MESESDDSDNSSPPNKKPHSQHRLRLYNPDYHAAIVRRLHETVFSYSHERLPTVTELKTMQGFVTFCSGTLSGYLLFSRHKKYYYLDYIGVNPKHRSQQVGKMLIERFTMFLDTHHYYALLEVEQNTEYTEHLIKWYERNRFSVYKKDLTEGGVYLTSMVRFPRDDTVVCKQPAPTLIGVEAIS